MIPRYSREKISKIWSEESMYNHWLQVEIATCEAWNELGIIPKEDLRSLKSSLLIWRVIINFLKKLSMI